MQSLHLHELDGMAPLLVGVLPEHVGQVGQVDSVLHTACCLELP